MADKIIIEGGVARFVREQVLSEAPLADLAPFLETRMPTILPILPDHTRLIAFDPNSKSGVLLVETLPIRQKINLHASSNDHHLAAEDRERARVQKSNPIFNVQFPYQYHLFNFKVEMGTAKPGIQNFTLDEGKLFWRPTAFRKMTDTFWPAKLFNIDSNARICWGTTQAETSSLAARVDEKVKTFQATIFNTHLGAKTPNGYASYVEWEKASENPLCYLEWKDFKNPTAANSMTADEMVKRIATSEAITVEHDTATMVIPEPPTTFTIGRAIEWFQQIPEAQKKRWLEAFSRAMKEEGLEVAVGMKAANG